MSISAFDTYFGPSNGICFCCWNHIGKYELRRTSESTFWTRVCCKECGIKEVSRKIISLIDERLVNKRIKTDTYSFWIERDKKSLKYLIKIYNELTDEKQ